MNRARDLERLAAVRPACEQDTQQLVGPAERDLLLQTILASPPAAAAPARHRRRYAVPVVLTAAAAAAAIAGSIALTAGSHHTAGQHPAVAGQRQAVSKPPVRTVAYIVRRTRAAVAAETSGSLRVIYTDRFGRDRYIYDLSSGAERFTSHDRSGAVIFDQSATGPNAAATSTVVDYPDKAWWTLNNDPADAGDGNDPASFRQQLAAGALVKVGDDTVNGQPAIHLRYPSAVFTIDGKKMATDTNDIWVDATTYLPIREKGSNRFATGSGGQARHGTRRVQPWQTDYQWSATPPSNVTVPIPAGFRHLAGPPRHLLTPGSLG